jgi:hypothetical protein
MKTVDVFARIDALDDGALPHVFGQGQLDEDAVDARIRIQCVDAR